MTRQRYWIAVVSKEHTTRGVEGNFMQVCHGKKAPLQRMKQDDWVIVYSPKQAMEGTVKCQAFTAIGQVSDDDVYQFQMTKDFIPFRRNIQFVGCTETPIAPLINDLEFIRNKTSWGFPFRTGFFEINEADFTLISSRMVDNETQG